MKVEIEIPDEWIPVIRKCCGQDIEAAIRRCVVDVALEWCNVYIENEAARQKYLGGESSQPHNAGESILAHAQQFRLNVKNQTPERAAAVRAIFDKWLKDNGIAITGEVDIVSYDPKEFLPKSKED